MTTAKNLLRYPAELHQSVKQAAAARGQTLNDFCTDALAAAVEQPISCGPQIQPGDNERWLSDRVVELTQERDRLASENGKLSLANAVLSRDLGELDRWAIGIANAMTSAIAQRPFPTYKGA